MVTKQNYHKSGFTIIEVVLVLAIAGLIFLAVFLALPALQRSQRDQDRKTSVSKVVSQLTAFQANNRGKLPSDINGATTASVEGAEKFDDSIKIEKPWEYFYHRYLITESNDDFRDPKGSPYKLSVKEGANDSDLPSTFEAQEYTMVINIGARCDGETITKDNAGKRNFTVRYRGEGGAVICEGA